MSASLLLSGHDTIECAYYLAALPGCTLDFERLAVEKEALRLAKVRRPKAIQLGSEEFLLMPNGKKSGYGAMLLCQWIVYSAEQHRGVQQGHSRQARRQGFRQALLAGAGR